MRKLTTGLLLMLLLGAIASLLGCGAGGAPLEEKDPGPITIRSTPTPFTGGGGPPAPP